MNVLNLLAKSKAQDEPWHASMLLTQHSADVLDAAMQILQVSGSHQLKTLGLCPDRYMHASAAASC